MSDIQGYFSEFMRSVETNNKRAIKNGAIGKLTEEELETALIYFGGKCAYSGHDIDLKGKMSIEHIIPIMSGGHTLAFNCVPVISNYNSSKSGYHLLDWWNTQTDGNGKSIYSHYRLLKLINYMIKNLEVIEEEEKRQYILKENEIDVFLSENDNDASKSKEEGKKSDFKRISQIETLMKLDILRIEDTYSLYEELEGLKLNPAIFFEEALYVLNGKIPENIGNILKNKINNLPDIFIDGKKIFKKEMDEKDIKIRKEVLEWTEEENIENKFGIIAYMDFEVLKKQKDIKKFLSEKKEEAIHCIGMERKDFNNLINKVPNILTSFTAKDRVEELGKKLNISVEAGRSKSSEMYRYIVNKPDLLLSGENMNILLKYAEIINIDKRLLKKGIPIATILDNIEVCIQILENAQLDIPEFVRKRILEKIINNSNGNLVRDAYRTLKNDLRSEDSDEIEKNAAKWIICMSEKYNTSEIYKQKRIDKTRNLYKTIQFNNEGHMVGVNPNAYIIPEIVRSANLNISREAEEEIINNIFFSKRIRAGERADKVYNELIQEVHKDNPSCDKEHTLQDAARWFVFISESLQIPLDAMFDKKQKDKYLKLTTGCYKRNMFDEHGNFINSNFEENEGKEELFIDEDYMKIIDAFFRSRGDSYLIGEELVKKDIIKERMYRELAKCKNKKDIKVACIKVLKEITPKKNKGGKKRGRKTEHDR